MTFEDVLFFRRIKKERRNREKDAANDKIIPTILTRFSTERYLLA